MEEGLSCMDWRYGNDTQHEIEGHEHKGHSQGVWPIKELREKVSIIRTEGKAEEKEERITTFQLSEYLKKSEILDMKADTQY